MTLFAARINQPAAQCIAPLFSAELNAACVPYMVPGSRAAAPSAPQILSPPYRRYLRYRTV